MSRVNLYFEGESKTNFEKRLNLAYRYRELSEVYFKYNNEINEMKGKTNEIK